MGEVVYHDQAIRIRPTAKQSMEITFLHEVLHALHNHLGYYNHQHLRTAAKYYKNL
jgi:hypothetical protein